jgi:hypothetical protein
MFERLCAWVHVVFIVVVFFFFFARLCVCVIEYLRACWCMNVFFLFVCGNHVNKCGQWEQV